MKTWPPILEEVVAAVEEKQRHINEVCAQMKKEMAEEAIPFIQEETRVLFEKYPQMTSFGWEQGDFYDDSSYSYEVRICADYLFIDGKYLWHWQEEDQPDSLDVVCPVWQIEAAKEIADVLKEIGEDNFAKFFGHSTVTVTKDGVTLEEFRGDG